MTEQNFTTEELNNEIWKPVYGFESLYHISNLGRVKSVKTTVKGAKNKLVKPHIKPPGYLAVGLCKNNIRHGRTIHRLVADAFICPLPEGMVTNHINANKLDNRPENLEYITHIENMKHAWSLGLMTTPEAISKRKETISKRKANFNPRAAYFGRKRREREDTTLLWLLIRRCLRDKSHL